MKLFSIILTALPLALATASSSHATNIRSGRNNNRELNSNNQWGTDGYDSSPTSYNDGYSYPSSSGSHHSTPSSHGSSPKPKPPPPKPKPAPKPASKPSSPSAHSTPSGYSTNKPYNSDKPAWSDDGYGASSNSGSYSQSSLVSSKVAHYNDNSSRGLKIGLVSSLFALVALAALLVGRKKLCSSNNRKIPAIDGNALSDTDSSNGSSGEEDSVDYDRARAVENYVEMTDQQRQQQSSSGTPPRHPRASKLMSKLMGKGKSGGAVSLGRDASRLSVGSLD